jgi:hypothetical protein
VYLEYADAIKEIHTYALRFISSTTRPDAVGMGKDEILLKISDADLRRTKAWESVLLLGDARATSAAREWREAVGVLARHAQRPANDAFDVVAAVSAVNTCRDNFYEAARLSLGITASFAPQSEWLSRELKNRADTIVGSQTPPDEIRPSRS